MKQYVCGACIRYRVWLRTACESMGQYDMVEYPKGILHFFYPVFWGWQKREAAPKHVEHMNDTQSRLCAFLTVGGGVQNAVGVNLGRRENDKNDNRDQRCRKWCCLGNPYAGLNSGHRNFYVRWTAFFQITRFKIWMNETFLAILRRSM